jgi:dTDP-4-dehydrorhamnose reductase
MQRYSHKNTDHRIQWTAGNRNDEVLPERLAGTGFDMSDINVRYVDQVNQVTGHCGPDRVFNCAAYTSVDKAESEPGTAYAVNFDGTANLTLAAKK